jgi:hypothetical protein
MILTNKNISIKILKHKVRYYIRRQEIFIIIKI